MDQSRVSDFDTAMLARIAFDKILEQIQTSNLNFQLRLSPFSASISLKKSFIRDKSGYFLLPSTGPMPANSENDELVEKKEHLNQKVDEMQNLIESKSETIQTLEEKITNVEASAYKSLKEKNDEVNTVKNSLKNANQEIAILKNELKSKHKVVKEKEKEVFRLDQKCENLGKNLKRVKEEVNSMKSDNKKFQKKQK